VCGVLRCVCRASGAVCVFFVFVGLLGQYGPRTHTCTHKHTQTYTLTCPHTQTHAHTTHTHTHTRTHTPTHSGRQDMAEGVPLKLHQNIVGRNAKVQDQHTLEYLHPQDKYDMTTDKPSARAHTRTQTHAHTHTHTHTGVCTPALPHSHTRFQTLHHTPPIRTHARTQVLVPIVELLQKSLPIRSERLTCQYIFQLLRAGTTLTQKSAVPINTSAHTRTHAGALQT